MSRNELELLIIVFILLIIFSLIIWYICWSIKSIKLIQKDVNDIQIYRFNKLMAKAENLNSSFNTKCNGLTSNINSVKIAIVAECKDLKANLTSKTQEQTDLLMSYLKEHRQTLSLIKENIKELKQQMKTNYQNVVSKFENTNICINNKTDEISSAIYNSYNALNSSIEKNRTTIKDNENAIKKMNSSLTNCLDKLNHIEELYRNLQVLHKKILEEESKISSFKKI